MSNIELRLYRYFVELCQEQSFSRAALRLKISPPTLTHQIQKLEKELGVRLLDRKTKRNIRLTQAGVRFLESARKVLLQANEAELTAHQAARGEIGLIEVGYMITATYTGLIQRCIGGFQKSNPTIDITLQQLSTVKQIDAILANELDVGFARLPTQFPAGLSGFAIYRQPIVLALPASHPLARKGGAISVKALANETFVSTSIRFDLAFNRLVESVAAPGGFKPKIWKRAEDLTTVLSYVSAEYGIAAVSEEMSNCHVPNVVFRKPTGGAIPDVLLAFMYRTNESSPACRAFIEAMRPRALKNLDR